MLRAAHCPCCWRRRPHYCPSHPVPPPPWPLLLLPEPPEWWSWHLLGAARTSSRRRGRGGGDANGFSPLLPFGPPLYLPQPQDNWRLLGKGTWEWSQWPPASHQAFAEHNALPMDKWPIHWLRGLDSGANSKQFITQLCALEHVV